MQSGCGPHGNRWTINSHVSARADRVSCLFGFSSAPPPLTLGAKVRGWELRGPQAWTAQGWLRGCRKDCWGQSCGSPTVPAFLLYVHQHPRSKAPPPPPAKSWSQAQVCCQKGTVLTHYPAWAELERLWQEERRLRGTVPPARCEICSRASSHSKCPEPSLWSLGWPGWMGQAASSQSADISEAPREEPQEDRPWL